MLTCERAYYAMVENLLEASSSSSSSSHLFGVSTQRRLFPDPDPRLSFNCMNSCRYKIPRGEPEEKTPKFLGTINMLIDLCYYFWL